MEDGLSLATKTGLLHVVATLALGEERILTLLVLRDFVQAVLLALLGNA